MGLGSGLGWAGRLGQITGKEFRLNSVGKGDALNDPGVEKKDNTFTSTRALNHHLKGTCLILGLFSGFLGSPPNPPTPCSKGKLQGSGT